MADKTLKRTIACIAEGQLWLLPDEDSGLVPVKSKFGAELKERLLKMRQKNEWKNQGAGEGLMSGGMLWGSNAMGGEDQMHVSISAVTAGKAGELFFIMYANDLCGVFSYDVANDEEQRLFHGTEHSIHTLDYSAEEESLICSISSGEGVHNLAVLKPKEGGGLREITEGDSLDTYPRWIPGQQQAVFQTAGIGRNRNGIWVETGPCQVEKLDFEDGEMVTLMEDSRYDFLLPQIDAEGNLYCIRRPYEKVGKGSVGTAMKDTLMFPVRLVQAGFGFLNMFSSMFTGKPLTSAGGPRSDTPDAKRLILYGNLVDAEKVMRENAEFGEEDQKAAVPRTWELMMYPEVGDPVVLARAVMAFTVTREGQIAYSNGSAIYTLDAQRKKRKLVKRRLVQQLAYCGSD